MQNIQNILPVLESDRSIYPRGIVTPFVKLWHWLVTVRDLLLNEKITFTPSFLQKWTLKFDHGCKSCGTCSNARDVSLVDDKSDFRCMNERPVIRCIRCVTQMSLAISYCTVFGFTQTLIYLVDMRYQFYRLVESLGWYISPVDVKLEACLWTSRSENFASEIARK